MYQCIGCETSVDDSGQCFCGKTCVDHKGRVFGENFVEVHGAARSHPKSSLATCPFCGWRGVLAPRIGLGCPRHGSWLTK
jgi:hypothetical protein